MSIWLRIFFFYRYIPKVHIFHCTRWCTNPSSSLKAKRYKFTDTKLNLYKLPDLPNIGMYPNINISKVYEMIKKKNPVYFKLIFMYVYGESIHPYLWFIFQRMTEMKYVTVDKLEYAERLGKKSISSWFWFYIHKLCI